MMHASPRSMLRTCLSPIARRAARAYVIGPELADALRACQQLSAQGFASAICYWDGEGDGRRQVADAYLAALDALARQKLNCYLSVKAPPLGFDSALLFEVLERARQVDVGIHFDSLSPQAADQTFSLIAKALASPHPKLGCTLPGRWRRSLSDADVAIHQELRVRVVKGQWADPSGREINLRAGFLAVVDRLAGRARHVSVATHDPLLAGQALRRLLAANTSCDLELLFGLPMRHAIREARAVGVPVRFYVPYGHAWLPYCLSQAQQNPRILWWVLRDLLLDHSFGRPEFLPPKVIGRSEEQIS